MKKVLIITRDGEYTSVLEAALVHAKYEVQICESVEEVVDLSPDVIIFDVSTRNFGADLQALADLKKSLGHQVFFVALLDRADKSQGSDFLHLGIDLFCVKGDSLRPLILKLNSI